MIQSRIITNIAANDCAEHAQKVRSVLYAAQVRVKVATPTTSTTSS